LSVADTRKDAEKALENLHPKTRALNNSEMDRSPVRAPFSSRAAIVSACLFVGAPAVAGVTTPDAASSVDSRADGRAEPRTEVRSEKAAARTPTTRETFVVEPFDNANGFHALDYLQAGLPAFVAERLGHLSPLKFAGEQSIFGRPAGSNPRWTVKGSFIRQADWKVAVTVRLEGRDGKLAEATRAGSKDEASRVALEAALEAFRKVLGDRVPTASPAVKARFGRDPYAFVLYSRGVALYAAIGRKGRSQEEAINILKRSLLIDPKVAETRRYLGVIHLEAGRPGHARTQWSVALEERPNYLPVLAGLAALDRNEHSAAAKDRYARLVELDPEDLDARRSFGEVLSDAGQLEQAQAELTRVLEVAPDDLRARRALALVLASRRAGPELAADLEQVVRLDPESVDARMDLGAAYLAIGRHSDAEAVYDDVLKRRPRSAGALKLAGDLARTRGDLKKASTLYGKLRWISPADPRPACLLGTAYYEAGNLSAAERWFTDASKYPGMMGEAYGNLGVIALKRGQPKEALWFLSRAAKRRPQRALVRFNYALALYSNDRAVDALNELHVAQKLEPSDSGAHFFAGVVALRLGLLQEAERGFREALRLDPQNEDARHNLSLLEPLVRPTNEGSLSFGVSTPPK
jgi:Flp pilus assembly protein TadD